MKLLSILILIIGISLISGCFYKSAEPEKIRPIDEQKPISDKTDYIVIVNSDSIFRDEAERFANNKNAELLTYSQEFKDVMPKLKTKKPIYTAIFATPEELTPDFIDNVDLSLRDIDSDVYLDTSFGIITSRDTQELKKYVDRLLIYSPPQKMKIYAVSPKYTYQNLEPDFGIEIKHHCLTNCGAAFCICDDENRATLQRIEEGFRNSNIIVMDVHGSPSNLILDNNEVIEGSPQGLVAKKPTNEEVCYEAKGGGKVCGPKMEESALTTNTNLLIAESCTTGRINGLPSKIDAQFGDYDIKGEINTSLVLSFLQGGVLNYIAATHVANTAIIPEETIIEESFLQGIPIGVSLKDLKNRYILVTEKYNMEMPGAPVNTDKFTRDFVLFQVRNWVLFGDPSITLSSERHKPINCIEKYSEKQTKNKKEIEVQVNFAGNRSLENSYYIDTAQLSDSGSVTGKVGIGVCVVKIPYIGRLKNITVTSVSGVDERYKDGKYPGNAFYQDLGDEVFIQIPSYAPLDGIMQEKPLVFRYEIITE